MLYQTLNPATEEVLQTFSLHTLDQARDALLRAEVAFQSWRKTSLDQRRRLVVALSGKLRERLHRYGSLITQEMGKPINQAEIEIDKCGRGCDYFAQHAEVALKVQMIPTEAAKSYVRYDPLGVILGIMPWNFPFWQVLRFAIPALMAGNVVLLKHAPNVPQCALEIEKLFLEVGFPEGVFQSLFLDNETIEKLISTQRIQGVSLTGSDRAGSVVAEIAGRNLVKTVFELGGSDPFIVFDDAEITSAIPVAVKSRMLNSGQSCIAAKRFLVAETVMEKFKSAFVKAVSQLRVGDPFHAETDIGPLARKDLLENLERQVHESVGDGAKIVVGGQRWGQKGYFFEPTILEGVMDSMVVFREEVFGPVASIMSFKSDEEAIRLANQTCYGLGASLWTKNTERAERIAQEIQAGSVFVNGMVKSDPRLPFGGIKRSGYGRELSTLGMHEFVNIKTIWVG